MIELKPVAIPVQEPAQEPVQEVNAVTPVIVEQTKPIVVSEEDDIESGHSKKTESENKEGMAEGVEGYVFWSFSILIYGSHSLEWRLLTEPSKQTLPPLSVLRSTSYWPSARYVGGE